MQAKRFHLKGRQLQILVRTKCVVANYSLNIEFLVIHSLLNKAFALKLTQKRFYKFYVVSNVSLI